jgi:hypothetical protein
MKKAASISITAVILAFAAISAQAQGPVLRANVPSAFVVTDNTLPAGTYDFQFEYRV